MKTVLAMINISIGFVRSHASSFSGCLTCEELLSLNTGCSLPSAMGIYQAWPWIYAIRNRLNAFWQGVTPSYIQNTKTSKNQKRVARRLNTVLIILISVCCGVKLRSSGLHRKLLYPRIHLPRLTKCFYHMVEALGFSFLLSVLSACLSVCCSLLILF